MQTKRYVLRPEFFGGILLLVVVKNSWFKVKEIGLVNHQEKSF